MSVRKKSLSACGVALAMMLMNSTVPVSYAQTAVADEADAPAFITLNTGKGTAVRLPRAAKNVFVADPKVANVNAVSNRLVYVFGAGDGETTLYAVDASDKVIYSSTVRVGNNINQVGLLLKVALPNAQIDVKSLNGIVFLSGFVGTPKDVEEAGRLAQQLVGERQIVVNRLETQTPVQVNLQVKIAEVSRETFKQIGVNWNSVDPTSGFTLGLLGSRNFIEPAQVAPIINPTTGLPTGQVFTTSPARFLLSDFGGYSLPFSLGNIFGINAEGAIDALEREGLLSVLAEPNLTALSGEKASFLAGGEFPVPVAQENQRTTVEFKRFGVGLDFTPVVHSSNRISLRVRPEVSQISDVGAVRTNSLSIPGISTRRAETVVELGSGQSFVIAGLIQNNVNTDISKLPGLGNIPILGALFKSDRFRRQETELVIVVTPYLVKPIQPDQVRLPTDGLRVTDDLSRFFLSRTFEQGLNGAEPLYGRGRLPTSSATLDANEAQPGFSFGK